MDASAGTPRFNARTVALTAVCVAVLIALVVLVLSASPSTPMHHITPMHHVSQ